MRPREVLSNGALLVSTTARELQADPLQFILQVSRRLPRSVPPRIGKALSIGNPGAVRAAYGAWIADQPQWARETLAATPSRNRRRLFAELANQLGVPDLIPKGELKGGLALRIAIRRGNSIEPSPKFVTADEPPSREDPPVDRALSVFHLLTNSIPHTGSGYAYRSHAVLKAQCEAGLRVAAATRLGYPVIVGKAKATHHDTIDGIDYYRLIPRRLGRTLDERTRQAADLLEPLVRSFGADILSTTTDYTNALVAQEVAARLGIPWTYEVRGLPEDTWVASQTTDSARNQALSSIKYDTLQTRETAAACAADHVFTLGSALRDDFATRGVPKSRMTVVNNAADPLPETDLMTPHQARARLGLPTEGTWVGSVTSLVAYEGIDVLLSAVAYARGQGADLRALIVGDGVARPELESQTRSLGLQFGVEAIFAGRLPKSDAAIYFQALDILAVPRTDQRVCRLVPPLKPLEAMAASRPILARDLPALQNLIKSAGSGVLVPNGDTEVWADALVCLAKDDEAQIALGQRGHNYVENNSWTHQGSTYHHALTRAVGLGLCSV